jgi:hypothetical protein
LIGIEARHGYVEQQRKQPSIHPWSLSWLIPGRRKAMLDDYPETACTLPIWTGSKIALLMYYELLLLLMMMIIYLLGQVHAGCWLHRVSPWRRGATGHAAQLQPAPSQVPNSLGWRPIRGDARGNSSGKRYERGLYESHLPCTWEDGLRVHRHRLSAQASTVFMRVHEQTVP